MIQRSVTGVAVSYRDQSAGPAAPRLPFGGGRLVRLIRGRSRGPAGPAPGFKGALRSGRRAAWLEPQVHEARVVVVHRHLSLWAALGVKSIGDMGTWKYATAAHAIATLAECEASDVSQHK